MKTHRNFIGYACGDDQPFVQRLHADLTAAGFQVWSDRESLLCFTFGTTESIV